MFRLARLADLDRIEHIYNSIHNGEENRETSIGWLRNIYPTRQTALQAIECGEMYVGEDDGVIFGCAKINQQQVKEYSDCTWKYPARDDDIMVLHTLAIDPMVKGNGYGKQFVAFYESFAKKNNCHYLRIDTNAKNTIARKMYHRLGFKEVGIVPCQFNGIPDVKLVCLEKKVNIND